MKPVRLLATVVALGAAIMITAAACSGNSNSGSTTSSPGSSTTAESVKLTVLGAASTRVVNDDLSKLAADLTPSQTLEYVNGGSSNLVQQLADGAPGDLFISADQKNMKKAVEAGNAKDPKVVATNSMVMVVPADNPAGITGVDDTLKNANVVLCDSQVPCGDISQTLMKENNIELNPVSLEQSVSDVLGKVTSGEADAGWVYRTDAAAAGEAVKVIEIPHADKHPNDLVAAVTTTSGHQAEATQLLDLLASKEMAAVWEKHGFTPVQ